MSEETLVPEEGKKEEIRINVDNATAVSMKMMEFDHRIAAAEADVAILKREKLKYLYDSNAKILIEEYNKKKEQEQA